MDFKIICRVCLEERKGLNSIFGASLAKMIMACTSVIVMEGDGLPHQICKQCTISVSRAFRFKELCEKSDNTLREYVNNSDKIDDLSIMKSTDLLLEDNTTLVNSCSVYSDLFLSKNDNPLPEPLLMEPSSLSTDINLHIESITDQYLPSLWNLKKTTDFCSNSEDNFSDNTFVNALQSLDCDKQTKDDWNNYDLNNDIESSNYIKSYIDLDHSSRIINEDQSRRQNETFACQICGKIFMDEKSFQQHNHMKDNQAEKKHMCNFCGKKYKENRLLLIHLRTHTGSRPLKCEICCKSFALPSSLQKHRLIHTGEKKFKCPICDKAFFQSSNLKSHLKVHTGEKNYICVICGKSFALKRNLDTHVRLHDANKPYICIVCNASFTTSSLLKRHETKHTGEKKYICSHCGQSFRLKSTLDAHIRFRHTKIRPYECSLCSKQYVTSFQLRRHMLSHKNERRHQCTVCNKMFLQKRHLESHMNTHLGQHPYSCMICGRNFTHSGSLSTHLKTHKKDVTA